MNDVEKFLWAISGITFLQIMTGFYLSQISNAISSIILIFHIITGILLLIVAVASITVVSHISRLKHLAMVNTILIVITLITGTGFIIFRYSNFYDQYMPYVQMALSIGIISNYAVMLGIKRTLDLNQS